MSGHRDGLVVVLSGPIGAGKTTLAWTLAKRGARPLATRTLLAAMARRGDQALDRLQLQRLGEQLDRAEGGLWVARAVDALLATEPEVRVAVVDAVRTSEQVAAIRARTPTRHVHLSATSDVLERRYEARRERQPQFEATWEEVRSNATESGVSSLAHIAELQIDTSLETPEESAAAVEHALHLQRWLG